MNKLGSVYPEQQVAVVGGQAFITCYSRIEPTWMKDGHILQLITLFNTIKLSNITESDGGVYTCRGYLDERGTQSFDRNSKLIVGGNLLIL